jgi:hypothetical protein
LHIEIIVVSDKIDDKIYDKIDDKIYDKIDDKMNDQDLLCVDDKIYDQDLMYVDEKIYCILKLLWLMIRFMIKIYCM